MCSEFSSNGVTALEASSLSAASSLSPQSMGNVVGVLYRTPSWLLISRLSSQASGRCVGNPVSSRRSN